MLRLLRAPVLLLLALAFVTPALAGGQPPGPPVVTVTPATGPGPGTPQPPPPTRTRKTRYYTIFTNNGSGWKEPVDRSPAPHPWRGWHVCSTALASPFPWCVPRYWKRGFKRIAGYSWEWIYYPAPPKPAGYFVYAQVTAYTPVDTPPPYYGCYCAADGTPVQIGVAGTNPVGCQSNIPRGTVIDIPGLWTVTIHDVGSVEPFCEGPPHIDVWMPYDTFLFESATWFQHGIPCGCSLGYWHRVFIRT